jgi:excisionase family DNA binding protein
MAQATTDLGRFFMTAQEAATHLRVSRHTVYHMVNGGRMPAVKVGGQIRIPRDELEAWIGAQRWFDGGKEQA